jgi:hypothetical protein
MMSREDGLALGILAGTGLVLGAFYVGRESAPCWEQLENCELRLLGRDIELLSVLERSKQENQG